MSLELEIQDLASQKVLELFDKSNNIFGKRFLVPTIRWDLTGKCAGRAGANTIRLNFEALTKYPEDFISETIPHEVAHTVAFQLYGRNIQPHGYQWKQVAIALGCKGDRCHEYELTPAKVHKKYSWKCNCMTHEVGINLHTKMLSGQKRFCLRCRSRLVIV